jgi:hypothetical protein
MDGQMKMIIDQGELWKLRPDDVIQVQTTRQNETTKIRSGFSTFISYLFDNLRCADDGNTTISHNNAATTATDNNGGLTTAIFAFRTICCSFVEPSSARTTTTTHSIRRVKPSANDIVLWNTGQVKSN